MDFKLSIPDCIKKLPLNVFLPAIWLVSMALSLLPDAFLMKIHVWEWHNENGFIIGITFLLSSAFVLIYVIHFVKKLASRLFTKLTKYKIALAKIRKLNDCERNVLLNLYVAPNYTLQLDYNAPMIQGLLSRGLIYSGNQQYTTVFYNNEIPMLFYLQPIVRETFDYYKGKAKKEMEQLQRRIDRERNVKRKEILMEKLQKCSDKYNYICRGGDR